ncbi:NAD(+) synthase, partial [candidate division KSB1 bacterium]
NKNGFKKVVIGISGGIDSALTSVIAVDALSKENVILISMPSSISSSETQIDAQKIAQNVGTEFYIIPIENILKKYEDTLSEKIKTMRSIVIENLQARIRGNILMAFANHYNWLVLTTGNKSETSVGYCTLYGDTAGGLAVIKDISKSMVYDLSNYRNKKAKFELIPKSIINREPTAELKPGQKDTDSLPPYPILDPILKAYVEEDKGIDEIAEMSFEKETVSKVVRMVDSNEYKRRQSPTGIKITQKAFGKDRRLPITNKYRYKC